MYFNCMHCAISRHLTKFGSKQLDQLLNRIQLKHYSIRALSFACYTSPRSVVNAFTTANGSGNNCPHTLAAISSPESPAVIRPRVP